MQWGTGGCGWPSRYPSPSSAPALIVLVPTRALDENGPIVVQQLVALYFIAFEANLQGHCTISQEITKAMNSLGDAAEQVSRVASRRTTIESCQPGPSDNDDARMPMPWHRPHTFGANSTACGGQ